MTVTQEKLDLLCLKYQLDKRLEFSQKEKYLVKALL